MRGVFPAALLLVSAVGCKEVNPLPEKPTTDTSGDDTSGNDTFDSDRPPVSSSVAVFPLSNRAAAGSVSSDRFQGVIMVGAVPESADSVGGRYEARMVTGKRH